MPNPETTIYCPIYDTLDGYPFPATHWYWQVGDKWTAVIGAWEPEDDWFADTIKDGENIPPKRVYSIHERPPHGTLIYARRDGSHVEEKIAGRDWHGEGILKSIPVIMDREAFRAFKREYGLRDDWHEPDEQGIDAKVMGAHFDNSGFPEIEMQVLFIKRENGGESWVARVNLANLCAWASQ